MDANSFISPGDRPLSAQPKTRAGARGAPRLTVRLQGMPDGGGAITDRAGQLGEKKGGEGENNNAGIMHEVSCWGREESV